MKTNSPKLPAAYCLLLAAYCLLPAAAFAQCPNVTLTLTPTPSTCMSNGTIRVAVSGGDAGNLQMTNAQYNITPVPPSSYQQPWATAAGGTLTGVPPGTYTAGLQAFCTTSGAWVTYSTTATVVVAASYTVPNVYFGVISKTLSCMPSGMIPIVVQHGHLPYTITMTSSPPGYTGPTTATITTQTGNPRSGSYTFEDLPAGAYTFSVTDNCNYNTILTTTLATASADFDPSFISAFLYNPSVVVQNDCRSVRVQLRATSSSHDAWIYYSTDANAAKYYEVALSDDSTTPPTTGWAAPTAWRDYILPVDYKTFRAQAGRVAVWIRVKGASCTPALLRTPGIATTNPVSVVYSNQTCTDFTLSHHLSLTTNTTNIFCFPYQWQITTNNGASTFVPWTSVTAAGQQSVHNVPYGAQIDYQDASGQTWTQTLMQTDPLNQVFVNDNNQSTALNQCIINSLPLTSSGILSSVLQIYNNNGNFPMGTRIETISWPAGGPAPNHPDITITTATSNVYSYTSAASPTSAPAPYPMTMPGTYTVRVTMPGCPAPRTISVSPTFYTATPMSYTSVEDCTGLTVFPTGQLGSIVGATTSTLPGTSTWFFLQSWPSGVTVNTARVQTGGSLFLPASGTYVIGMARSSTQCSGNTLNIVYNKRQLSLNAALTTAYACPGGGTQGFIRVQGTNGSGSYTYELRTGNTVHDTNTAGTFSYGSAGETYTVRVIDTGCGNSFDQVITILSLNAAAIASSNSPNNEFCSGNTIQLNCMNLGNTTYNWSGPGAWSSTQQNPTRPNATAAMAGTYTVSVIPENCTLPITDSVSITVNPTVTPSVTITAAPE